MFVDETKRAQFPSVPPSVTRIATPKTRWEEREGFRYVTLRQEQ